MEQKLRNALRQPIAYRDVANDPAVLAFQQTIEALAGGKPSALEAARLFYDWLGHLVAAEYDVVIPGIDLWQRYLLQRILVSDNPFSRRASQSGDTVSWDVAPLPMEAEAARHDLALFQQWFAVTVNDVAACIRKVLRESAVPFAAEFRIDDSLSLAHPFPRWRRDGGPSSGEYGVHDPFNTTYTTRMSEMAQQMVAAPDWARLVGTLAGYYRVIGFGLFAKYLAFRWERKPGGEGYLQPIPRPDIVDPATLVGYEEERAEVARNTAYFLDGLPAQNVLLYGARGTGKSSTVKSLLHTFGHRGLRLIEVPKRSLVDYPRIVRQVESIPQKFILFIDDLSFEEHETEYKDLKAILEGGITARPGNVLLYATSNRRHLVQELFRDRNDWQPLETRREDTVEEKLSLVDRFGLTVVFLSPDQALYLRIVEKLAQDRGLKIQREELRRRALQWEKWQNGRSGRSARPLVDRLTSEERARTDP
jgi:predicted AAA+ superfamily ATPase